jgi:GT2 family glycosyltransferase
MVTIIIVNWNGKEMLKECLTSLKKQSYSDFSVILVDNGSEDGSVAFVKKHFSEVQIISLSENVGFSVANNLAIKSVNSKYVALLNNDAVADPLWLEKLVAALDETPEAGFAASRILLHDTPHLIDRAGDSYTTAGTGLLRGRGADASSYGRREWIFGACAAAALYRLSMLKDIGLFDEDFFLLYEDVDLSFRAQLRNYKCLYVPEAKAFHKASTSIVHDSPTSVYYSHRNLEWVYFQNMPARLIRKSILSHMVYDMAALVYFFGNGRFRPFIKAKFHAIKGCHKVLEKRRIVQGGRLVDEDRIWRTLEPEHFLPRLKLRFNKRRG